MQAQTDSLKIARWLGDAAADEATPVFTLAPAAEQADALPEATLLLMDGDEAHAHALLARGASRVLLGDAALLDGTLVRRMVEQYGGERIGVVVTARKHHVNWMLDTVSNADFRCLTPSYGKPGWELLLSNGEGTGADAEWWLGEMMGCGAVQALLRVDMRNDDLNVCAGLCENFGEKLWFTPWQEAQTDLEPWVRYGRVRQLLLPAIMAPDDEALARLHLAAAAGLESDLNPWPENQPAMEETV